MARPMMATINTPGVLSSHHSGRPPICSPVPDNPYANPTCQTKQMINKVIVAFASFRICLSFSFLVIMLSFLWIRIRADSMKSVSAA